MKLLMIGGSEIIFIVLLVILLFGGKKIPELMRGVGKGVRSFKEGMNGIENEINGDAPQQPTQTNAPEQPQATTEEKQERKTDGDGK